LEDQNTKLYHHASVQLSLYRLLKKLSKLEPDHLHNLVFMLAFLKKKKKKKVFMLAFVFISLWGSRSHLILDINERKYSSSIINLVIVHTLLTMGISIHFNLHYLAASVCTDHIVLKNFLSCKFHEYFRSPLSNGLDLFNHVKSVLEEKLSKLVGWQLVGKLFYIKLDLPCG
jgi:hypothetical protein